MDFDNPADHRQPHPGTRRMRIELFKEAEELGLVPQIDALAVIANEEHDLAIGRLHPDLDPGVRLVA